MKKKQIMFEWEESVFLGIKNAYKRFIVKPQELRDTAVGTLLNDCRGELLWLGQMIYGSALNIFETDNRVLRCGSRIFLPQRIALSDSKDLNASLYRLKMIIASVSLRDGWTDYSEERLQANCDGLGEEFPGLGALIEACSDVFKSDDSLNVWSWMGHAESDLAESTEDRTLIETADLTPDDWNSDITEIEGKGQFGVEELEELVDLNGEDLPIHTFEKAETLEEYDGLNRKVDGEDELGDHQEALDKLDLKHVLRSAERPGSIYRSDVILNGGDWLSDTDESGVGVPYREWDYKKHRYREDWCYVRSLPVKDGSPEWIERAESRTRSITRRLKRHLAVLANERMQAKRQPQGGEWDLDAVVDGLVQLKTGTTPSERLYIERKRSLPDIAILVLLDSSYSTDSYIEDHRALDVIRDSVFSIGDTFEGYVSDFSVASFASNTRRACSFGTIKSFDDSWQKGRLKLGGIEPNGYTRIGPAIRHGLAQLEVIEASRKAILLLTDGRPCDYDQYEGTYGIKDVHKCVEEARLKGVSTFAFAIEKKATETFPMMFAGGHFDVLPHPDELPEAMLKVFEKILAS